MHRGASTTSRKLSRSARSGSKPQRIIQGASTSMSSETAADTFQQQALEVREPGDDFDPNAEPQTGEEFLMKVLYERKKCPAVVVNRPKVLGAKPTTQKVQNSDETELSDCSPSSLRPTNEWKSVQVDDFQATRKKIEAMRSELSTQNYSNELEPPLTTDSSDWQLFCRQNPPLLRTILRINQRSLELLLDMISEWLREGADPPELSTNDEEQQEPVASSSSAAALNSTTSPPFDLSSSQQWLGAWLYASLACLHLPLEPNVHSTLRDIARNCIRLRNRLLEQEMEKAVPYNLFIYIIAKAFGQLDFAEFV